MIINLDKYYTPHSKSQADVHASKARKKVLKCGRRWAKTRTGEMEGLKTFVEICQEDPIPGLVPPVHLQSIFPSFRVSVQAWHELQTFIPPEMIGQIKEQDMMIYLLGLGKRAWGLWEIKSADNPSSLVGTGADFYHISEAQDISQDAWNNITPQLTSPGRKHALFVEGIPAHTRTHWFSRLCDQAKRDTSGEFEYFHRTTYDNPLIKTAEIDAQRRLMTDKDFRRFHLAEDVEYNSPFFGDVRTCIRGELLKEPVAGRRYVMGVDVGKKVDSTVVTIIDVNDRQLVAYREIQKMNYNVQLAAITEAYKMWGISQMQIDSTGVGDPIYDALRYEGLNIRPFVFTAATRDRILTNLALAIEKGGIFFPYLPSLIDQLESFYPEKVNEIRYKAVSEAAHDDYVLSLALCLDLLPRHTGFMVFSSPAVHKVPMPNGPLGGGAEIYRKPAHQQVSSPKVKQWLSNRKQQTWDEKLRLMDEAIEVDNPVKEVVVGNERE